METIKLKNEYKRKQSNSRKKNKKKVSKNDNNIFDKKSKIYLNKTKNLC